MDHASAQTNGVSQQDDDVMEIMARMLPQPPKQFQKKREAAFPSGITKKQQAAEKLFHRHSGRHAKARSRASSTRYGGDPESRNTTISMEPDSGFIRFANAPE